MPDLDFFAIKPLNGDRKYAFEEFCTHLARRDERVPPSSSFIRLEGAGGDGGVECCWQLPDGTKWGWQSKLLRRLDKAQIERSVKTALRIHPELTRYVVCLPFDLSGPTGRGGIDQQSRWREYVRAWKRLAARRGMRVEFDLWPKSHLIDRLIGSDPTGGRLRFWFDEQHLTREWFERHVADVAADARPRYQPELNVQVPISEVFDALGQTPRWVEARGRQLRTLEKEVERFSRPPREPYGRPHSEAVTRLMQAAIERLREGLQSLRDLWERKHKDSLERARQAVRRACDATGEAEVALRREIEAEHGPGAADSASFRQFHAEYMVSFPTADYEHAKRLLKLLDEVEALLHGPVAQVVQDSVLLVTGVAGAGKTHAICDAARQRLGDGLLSVVILGERLTAGEVTEQVRQILGLPGDQGRDQLLVALDAAGEASHAPLTLFIDALNEREPRSAWKTELGGLVEQVRRYPWLRLCLSCRSTYLDAVLPAGFQLPAVEHRGFAGVEFEACFAFFAHWGLEPPSVPLLQSEYANPLFLRMVCVGLSRTQRQPLADRPFSLAEVVDLLLTSAEQAAAERLDVDRREGCVRRALESVLDEMVTAGKLQLPWQRANELVNALLPARTRSRSLLDFLLREGLLIGVRTTDGNGGDHVRFGFERLGEYLFVARALDGVDHRRLDCLFAEGGPFHVNLTRYTLADLQGLAEALAIALPERFGRELVDSGLPLPRRQLLAALIRSLSWRHPDSFTRKTKQLVREAIRTEGLSDLALEEVLSLAARGGHPLGAAFVDEVMRQESRIKRDAFMCRFLHLSWQEGGVARRLSEWALHPSLGRVSEPATQDWAQTLLWFCLAADRRVRDHATMAVVALMEHHPRAWPSLIDRLGGVDDEYVTERLLLAVYGSLIRADDREALAACARVVWGRVFAAGPPLNALIRDHARCIVEMAAVRTALPRGVDLALARSPYRSVWPDDWASATEASAETNERGRKQEPGAAPRADAEGPAMRKLRYSVEHGDFAIYTMPSALETSRRAGIHLREAQRWILREVERMGFNGELFDPYDGYMLYEYGGGRGRPRWAERIGKKYQWIALYRLVGLLGDHVPVQPSRWEASPPPEAPIPLQAPGERNLDPTLLLRRSRTDFTPSWWAPIQIDFQVNSGDEEWLDDFTFPDSGRLIEVIDPQAGRSWLTLQVYAQWNTRTDEDDRDKPRRDCFMQIRSYLVAESEHERLWRWLRRQDLRGRWMPEGAQWLPHVFAGEYPWGVQAQVTLELFAREHHPSASRVPVTVIPTAVDQPLEFEDAYRGQTISLLQPDSRFFEGMGLRWDGASGYCRADGQPVFRVPSLTEPGPKALLVDREWLEGWLRERGIGLVWTVLSEKQVIPGGWARHGLGFTVHSRAHRLHEGRVQPSKGITYRQRAVDVGKDRGRVSGITGRRNR